MNPITYRELRHLMALYLHGGLLHTDDIEDRGAMRRCIDRDLVRLTPMGTHVQLLLGGEALLKMAAIQYGALL